jgi:hypothetical protein
MLEDATANDDGRLLAITNWFDVLRGQLSGAAR